MFTATGNVRHNAGNSWRGTTSHVYLWKIVDVNLLRTLLSAVCVKCCEMHSCGTLLCKVCRLRLLRFSN